MALTARKVIKLNFTNVYLIKMNWYREIRNAIFTPYEKLWS